MVSINLCCFLFACNVNVSTLIGLSCIWSWVLVESRKVLIFLNLIIFCKFTNLLVFLEKVLGFLNQGDQMICEFFGALELSVSFFWYLKVLEQRDFFRLVLKLFLSSKILKSALIQDAAFPIKFKAFLMLVKLLN